MLIKGRSANCQQNIIESRRIFAIIELMSREADMTKRVLMPLLIILLLSGAA